MSDRVSSDSASPGADNAQRSLIGTSLARGRAAARQNLKPGIVLWAVGVIVLVGYFSVPPIRQALDVVASVKDQYGYGFSIASTAVFGGLIPWLVARWRNPPSPVTSLRGLAFLLVFWAIKGLEVDALYRFQAWMFGDNRQPTTLAVKMLVDQLLYVPLWAIPTTVLLYQWRDDQFVWRVTGRRLNLRWYIRDVVPVMISNWAVWIPAVLVIYMLPLSLQLPIQNLVLCLWSLMLIVLVRDEEE